jgi:hypothetical protein
MRSALNKLIEISSDPLHRSPAPALNPPPSRLRGELSRLLATKNGFYAFESALLVRPDATGDQPRGLSDWNTPSLWRATYELDLAPLYFFAEDVFGGQFALSGDQVVSFNPETAETEVIADTLEGWAAELLNRYDYRTGHSLAREWHVANGPLRPGERLVPKQLFVLGGDFEIANLRLMNEVSAMRARGPIATRIAGLPDGTRISFDWKDG